MTNHNLRYYALGALTGLTALGWVLDKITPEISTAVFAVIGAVITADIVKHRENGSD
jgi:hypothetical protein